MNKKVIEKLRTLLKKEQQKEGIKTIGIEQYNRDLERARLAASNLANIHFGMMSKQCRYMATMAILWNTPAKLSFKKQR